MRGRNRLIHRPMGQLTRAEADMLTATSRRVMADETASPTVRLAARHQVYEALRFAAPDRAKEFIMIEGDELAAVARHLRLTCTRRAVAIEVLLQCLVKVERTTGEIGWSRRGLADAVGIHPRVVTVIMGELEKCGAIRREYFDDDGYRSRGVRYFLSPRIGSHLPKAARLEAKQAAPPLKLVEGARPKPERRAVADVRPLAA